MSYKFEDKGVVKAVHSFLELWRWDVEDDAAGRGSQPGSPRAWARVQEETRRLFTRRIEA